MPVLYTPLHTETHLFLLSLILIRILVLILPLLPAHCTTHSRTSRNECTECYGCIESYGCVATASIPSKSMSTYYRGIALQYTFITHVYNLRDVLQVAMLAASLHVPCAGQVRNRNGTGTGNGAGTRSSLELESGYSSCLVPRRSIVLARKLLLSALTCPYCSPMILLLEVIIETCINGIATFKT